jgi:hypothetical protein
MRWDLLAYVRRDGGKQRYVDRINTTDALTMECGVECVMNACEKFLIHYTLS